MVRFKRERYQHGSIRKVPRAKGFAWEFRYYDNAPDGQRKLRVQTFDAVQFPTETAVRKAIEPQLASLNAGTLGGKIDATLGTIIDRYLREELPTLRHSTQTTNKSLIELHIRPKWGDVRLANVTALGVKNWIDKLPFGSASKARTRNTISRLLDLAMLWEYIPFAERNPMALVKIKGSTKREKKLVIITPAQFKALVKALPEPYNLMALVSGCLGLRVSETLALKWEDFDFKRGMVTIRQVFTHSKVQELPKTDTSGDPLPVHPKLVKILRGWKERQGRDYPWLFASPRTGRPYSDSTILTDYLKPTATKLGIKGLGWHTFRHSYRSWMSSQGVEVGKMKDLMRHSDIATTMNVYGKSVSEEMRSANALVVKQLL